MKTVLGILAIFLIIVMLIGWGWWHDKQDVQSRRQRTEVCRTIEDSASRTLCVKLAR